MSDRDTANQDDAMEALRAAPATLPHLEKLAAVGQLSRGVAHELNNSFQNILAALELVRALIAAGRSGEAERFIASAIGAARNAATLNQRVFDLLRTQPLASKPLVVNELILGLEQLLRHGLSRSVKLVLALSPDPWRTHCDENHTEGALLNLVVNARDAMPDGGTVTIETRNVALEGGDAARPKDLAPGQYVCITVMHSGSGKSSASLYLPRDQTQAA